MRSRLFTFSVILAAVTLLLVLAGGLVTSHDAGLAVPDWPLSYGRFFPPMVGNIFWEHGHRMIAGCVAVLTLVQAILIQRSRHAGWLKRLAWISVGAVVLQALLGGLTVLFLLPAPVSIAHACLAQTFFCWVAVLSYFLSVSDTGPPQESFASEGSKESSNAVPSTAIHDGLRMTKSLFRLSLMTAAFIYLQLIFGATIRHTGHGVVPHVAVAFLVALHVFFLLIRVSNFFYFDRALRWFAYQLGFLTLFQIFLGMGAFIFTRMLQQSQDRPSSPEVFFTAAHQTTGALVLATSVLLVLISHARTRAPQMQP